MHFNYAFRCFLTFVLFAKKILISFLHFFFHLSPTRESDPEKPGLSGNPLAPASRRRISAAAIHRELQNSLCKTKTRGRFRSQTFKF